MSAHQTQASQSNKNEEKSKEHQDKAEKPSTKDGAVLKDLNNDPGKKSK